MKASAWELVVKHGISLNTADGGKTWCITGPIIPIQNGMSIRWMSDDVKKQNLVAEINRLVRKKTA